MRMSEQKAIKRVYKPSQRILQALRGHNGQMSRTDCWNVAGRALKAGQLDLILRTHLAGLVTEIEAQRTHKNKEYDRTKKVWALTEAGWLASGGLPTAESSEVVNANVVARLLKRLANSGDKWAKDVLQAAREWDTRSRVEPVPTVEDIRNMLWRMLESPDKNIHPFARHYLKQMAGAQFRDWQALEKARAKEQKAERKRRRRGKVPLTPDAVERINAARERNGEPPLELKGQGIRQAKKQAVAPSGQLKTPVVEASPSVSEISTPVPAAPTKPVVYLDQLDRFWVWQDGQARQVKPPKPELLGKIQVVKMKNVPRSWNPFEKSTEGETIGGFKWDITKSPLSPNMQPLKPAPVQSATVSIPPLAHTDVPTPAFRSDHGAQVPSDLLAKIQAAGYQINSRGEVLFDLRWIPVNEWVQRMGWKEK